MLNPRPRPSTLREFRYTRDDYTKLVEAGLFEGTRVELIRGRLIEMPPISDEHGASVMRSVKWFRRLFPEDLFTVRQDLPFIAVDDSAPQPDLCVVAGAAESIRTHPSSCLLIVEISMATLAFDRAEKGPLYAESGVADYWIINLVDRVLEVYRDPKQTADGTWAYASVTDLTPDQSCAPLAVPGQAIRVADLLPG